MYGAEGVGYGEARAGVDACAWCGRAFSLLNCVLLDRFRNAYETAKICRLVSYIKTESKRNNTIYFIQIIFLFIVDNGTASEKTGKSEKKCNGLEREGQKNMICKLFYVKIT